MGFKNLILAILICSSFNGTFSQEFDSLSIKVVSYNIWYDNPQNTDHPWSDRKNGVIETLLKINPDIFCVQEALDHQVHDLEITTYNCFGVGRDDGEKGGEYSAIFYDTTRFGLTDGGNFWLSEFPGSAGSKGWDAVCVRIATWAELKDKNAFLKFYVFNTHFDHVGDTARTESAKLLQLKINEIAKDHPIILTGDFNCLKGSQPYNILVDTLNKKPLEDCRYSSELKIKGPDYSFVGSEFSGQHGNIIDHIFVSKDIKVIKSEIIENYNQGKCPSDHLPVAAILELPKNTKHEK
jgi:endonuclease/exonuclease/phosphatase family metal-dependent hydrolase